MVMDLMDGLGLSRFDCQVHQTHAPRIDRGGLFTVHRHHVQPLAMGGADAPENVIYVCPTGHDAIHELLRAWVRVDGEPSWEIRRHYHYVERTYARLGYERWVAAGRPGRTQA